MSSQQDTLLTGKELELHKDYVEKRMLNGFKNNNAFDLLEAESAISRVGTFKPGQELKEIVLRFLNSNRYHTDFDMLRLTGYLKDKEICSILEKRFADLKDIWKEQDVIRMAESFRTMLLNVTRRANELNSLKVAADPYLNTLDTFFEKSFSQRNLDRFPKLKELRDKLYQLRQDGVLSKDNILAVIDSTRNSVDKLVFEKENELKENYQDSLPKPNRLIALYYCLLESLLLQKSTKITVDDEFVDKISQDFRAAVGHGTKRFVLNTLLKFNHPGFAEIAAEARYGIQHSVIEKVERKERGELEWRTAKIDLNDMQVYELYRTATEVIAQNPNPEVFETLLYTYTVPSLLLGLRSLEKAMISPMEKLRYLKRFFSLGTVNDYVFIRSVEVLASMETPASRHELAKILASRYGWRKVTIPKLAFKMINEGIEKSVTSADMVSIVDGLIDKERHDAYLSGEEMGFPYDNSVYEQAVDKLVQRFIKNPFHGLNEVAILLFFRKMLVFIAGTPVTFAIKAKRQLLELLRRSHQISAARVKYMLSDVGIALDKLEKRFHVMEEKERNIYSVLRKELRLTITSLNQRSAGYEHQERQVRELPQRLINYVRTGHMGTIEEKAFLPVLEEMVLKGARLMTKRTKNLDESTKKSGLRDGRMYPVRYPASTSAILRATVPLRIYYSRTANGFAGELLQSFGTLNELKFPGPIAEIPNDKKIDELLNDFDSMLGGEIKSTEVMTRSIYTSLLTTGAVRAERFDVLEQLTEALYNGIKPDSIRLAFLARLPIDAKYIRHWLFALSRENEAVLDCLRSNIDERELRRLQTLIPELVDLFY